MNDLDYESDVYDLYPEDKLGFADPVTPTHALQLLNRYMRTDILYSVHYRVHRMRDAGEPGSPIHRLTGSLETVIHIHEDIDMSAAVSRNPLHVNRHYDFRPEQDYRHDIRLMKHHQKRFAKIIKELDERNFYDGKMAPESVTRNTPGRLQWKDIF